MIFTFCVVVNMFWPTIEQTSVVWRKLNNALELARRKCTTRTENKLRNSVWILLLFAIQEKKEWWFYKTKKKESECVTSVTIVHFNFPTAIEQNVRTKQCVKLGKYSNPISGRFVGQWTHFCCCIFRIKDKCHWYAV